MATGKQITTTLIVAGSAAAILVAGLLFSKKSKDARIKKYKEQFESGNGYREVREKITLNKSNISSAQRSIQDAIAQENQVFSELTPLQEKLSSLRAEQRRLTLTIKESDKSNTELKELLEELSETEKLVREEQKQKLKQDLEARLKSKNETAHNDYIERLASNKHAIDEQYEIESERIDSAEQVANKLLAEL
jgi:hypothetical protein